jgi:hypothetical protein
MEAIPKEHFVHLNDAQREKFIDIIFRHYRSEGFPYFPTHRGFRDTKFEELMAADMSNILRSNVINRTNHGITLAWSYMPHAFDVRCQNMITPLEAFNDDKLLKSVIRKSMKLGDTLSDSTIRGLLRLHSGVQAVSNFRPTAAAAIYEHYAAKGVVWDMSGGWGGRLLGAVKADVDHYIATEPSKFTHKALNKIGADYWDKSRFTIECKGSEEYKPQKNSLTLCFTSPPYFDLEQYADEPSQSFKKYEDKNMWVEGFLLETIKNCYYGLKKGGYMLVNIADPKKRGAISLELETVRCAKLAGFTHVNSLALVLKSPLGSKAMFKSEPVFVFKK